MNRISEELVAANTGWAGEMRKGQVLRITATTIVDFVCFDLHNLRERFDQARTKVYNKNLYVSTGDKLMSKSNLHLMTVVHDGWKDGGTHDLQFGTCSASRFRLAKQEGKIREYYGRDWDPPDHGCWENLASVLEKQYGIAPEDIPSPLNLNQHNEIDGATGKLEHTTKRPPEGTYVDFRAERDLLVAFSACPDPPVGGKDVRVAILEGGDQ
jgi:uncharacterized protein YcgI (DUF1989 family)